MAEISSRYCEESKSSAEAQLSEKIVPPVRRKVSTAALDVASSWSFRVARLLERPPVDAPGRSDLRASDVQRVTCSIVPESLSKRSFAWRLFFFKTEPAFLRVRMRLSLASWESFAPIAAPGTEADLVPGDTA